MSSTTAAKARQNFSEIVSQAAYGKERIVLTRRGKELAAVIPIEDLRILEELEDEIDLREAKKALADVKKHGTVPWDQVKKKLDKKTRRKSA